VYTYVSGVGCITQWPPPVCLVPPCFGTGSQMAKPPTSTLQGNNCGFAWGPPREASFFCPNGWTTATGPGEQAVTGPNP
jgi:hypothetical protein